jgi:soluble lytic murein transglycosylase-like protein
MNHLRNPDLIVAGQRLRVSGGNTSTRTHTVGRGETLSGIAARYGTTVAAITRANRIPNPNLIVVGAKLRIPRGGVPYAAPAPAAAPSIASSLEAQARAHGVDPALVKAVAWQESGWTQNVRSSVGAIGVMQVMPGTARWVNRYLGGHNLNVHVADDNVHLGVMYLRHLLDSMSSVRGALAAYYSGPGSVGKRLNRGQKAYVDNVLALMKRF